MSDITACPGRTVGDLRKVTDPECFACERRLAGYQHTELRSWVASIPTARPCPIRKEAERAKQE